MIKLLTSVFLLAACAAQAQNTVAAAGTLQDTAGTAWINATWRLTPVSLSSRVVYIDGTAATPTSGQVSSSGVFTAGQVPLTSRMQPAGSTLTATLCSVTSAPCATVTGITVTGTTPNIGTILSANLAPPRVPAGPLVYAYNANEIINPTVGTGYINTTTNTQYLFVGGTWVQVGNSGVFPSISVTNHIVNSVGLQVVTAPGCTLSGGEIGTSCYATIPISPAQPDTSYSNLCYLQGAAGGEAYVTDSVSRFLNQMTVSVVAGQAGSTGGGTVTCLITRSSPSTVLANPATRPAEATPKEPQ